MSERRLVVPYTTRWSAENSDHVPVVIRRDRCGIAYADETFADRDRRGVLWERAQSLRGHDDWPDWPEGMATAEPPICLRCAHLARTACPAAGSPSASPPHRRRPPLRPRPAPTDPGRRDHGDLRRSPRVLDPRRPAGVLTVRHHRGGPWVRLANRFPDRAVHGRAVGSVRLSTYSMWLSNSMLLLMRCSECRAAVGSRNRSGLRSRWASSS